MFQYSHACCQVHVGACGYVLSCLTLNGVASRGPGHMGHLPDAREPPGMATGAQLVVESDMRNKADWADSWQNSARSWLPRWGKDCCESFPSLVF
jgi:hypothetical protein